MSISDPGLFQVSKVKASLEIKANIWLFAKQKQAKQNIQNLSLPLPSLTIQVPRGRWH